MRPVAFGRAMSAIGTKRTSHASRLMSAIGGKADMRRAWRDVALMTHSGHFSNPYGSRIVNWLRYVVS